MLKTSRTTIFALSLSLAALTVGGLYLFKNPPVTKTTDKQPNIIFIIADDIAWQDYGFNQHPHITTPHIDRLANEGVLFNQAYTVNSICRPSLASMITGLYPSQHGITVNARVINQHRGKYDIGLPPFAKRMNELNTLPRELSQLGYRSLQSGKWWEEGYANGGFDDGDKIPQGLFRHVTRANVIGREGLQPIFDFINQNRDQPFFIWYAPQMPHTPHNPPAAFLNPYLNKTNEPAVAKYWGMVSWFDNTIGQLVAYLEAQGLRDNTVIIYMADNGISPHTDLEHAGFGEGKDTPYEMGIRTPIIFNWPSHWPAARRDMLIASIDVFPTLMDLLHRPAGQLSGKSILATVTDGKQINRNYLVGEGYEDSGKEVFNNPRKFRWIRQDQWKLIEFTSGQLELYDLHRDANESNNLATQEADQVKILQQTLHRALP